MKTYSEEFKAQIMAQMLPPTHRGIPELARETGIPKDTPGAPATVAFGIEADSWLLRLVAPRLEVRYDRETRRLLSYQGASNLLDADRGVQNVTITYRYSN